MYVCMYVCHCIALQCIEVSIDGPIDFAEVPFSEYQGGEFSADDIEDTLFEWYVRTYYSMTSSTLNYLSTF